MVKELTPEFAIKYTRLTTGILFMWPLSAKVTQFAKISFKIGWWISLIFCAICLAPVLLTAYDQRGNFMGFSKQLCTAGCGIQALVKMIIGKRHYHRYQYLIEEMETFVKNANLKQRKVIINYVKRIAPFHCSYNMISLMGCLVFILAPFALKEHSFPLETDYPFSVDEHPVYDIIYLVQVIGIVQCGCTGPLDCQCSLLLWYAIMRLELLAEKLRHVNSAEELKDCIRMHQHMLWYIDEIIRAVRPMVATTVVLGTICIAGGAVHLVSNELVDEKMKFAAVGIAYSLELLCVAWAAGSLTTACEDIGWALYNSPWMRNSKEFNRTAIFVMQRCQKTPKIAIDGLFPELSMNYYALYMSATYSFFTALRVMLKKMSG